jgi:oxygen-independent coproporphyrinogen-3 oxidase
VKERVRGNAPHAFTEALCREIEAFEGPRDLHSIFFGGGTPSLLTPDSLAQVFGALRARFRFLDPEITLEVNPDDVTSELVRIWASVGINRISMGVQSFDDRVLRYLGRRHNAARALEAIDHIAGAFSDWNIDLIFGAPPIEAWTATLRQAAGLQPPHIATYGLTYEEGTPFARRALLAIDDETSLHMYQEAEELLAAYDHYEISNFCIPGRASRHNLVYWRNEPYAGFGTGAYSFVHGVRARNFATNDEYLRAPGEQMEALELTEDELKVETLIQHFRLREGLPFAYYRARFGTDPREDFGPLLDELQERGLLQETSTHFVPTPQGFYLNNEIGLALVP